MVVVPLGEARSFPSDQKRNFGPFSTHNHLSNDHLRLDVRASLEPNLRLVLSNDLGSCLKLILRSAVGARHPLINSLAGTLLF